MLYSRKSSRKVSMQKAQPSIVIPDSYNYIGVFLTFDCTLKCSYCINHESGLVADYDLLEADDWIRGLNRIQTRKDLPITLQGGEPTHHKYFYEIINGIDKSINIDLLTNGMFNVKEFISKIQPDRLKRKSKYASIRFSYHIETMDLDRLVRTVLLLQDKGYSVGVWIVDHPKDAMLVKVAQEFMLKKGIDCRLKEFLGRHNYKQYGTFRYPDAQNGKKRVRLCKPSELLIAPNGNIHRCHYDLYSNQLAYANIKDDNIVPITDFTLCTHYGNCNSCDIKIKTNRFQEFGHSSVEIKEIGKEVSYEKDSACIHG